MTKRTTAGGPQMPGDYGVYSPAGYWSHCAAAMKRATLVESLVALGFLQDEPEDGRSVFTLISMTGLVIYEEQSYVLFFFYSSIICTCIYYRHYGSSLLQNIYYHLFISIFYLYIIFNVARVARNAKCILRRSTSIRFILYKNFESNATNGTLRAGKLCNERR